MTPEVRTDRQEKSSQGEVKMNPPHYLFLILIYLLIWLCRVFAAARGVFTEPWGGFVRHGAPSLVVALRLSCSTGCRVLAPNQVLSPAPCIATWILNHWITNKSLLCYIKLGAGTARKERWQDGMGRRETQTSYILSSICKIPNSQWGLKKSQMKMWQYIQFHKRVQSEKIKIYRKFPAN